jgi:hypothetical protein
VLRPWPPCNEDARDLRSFYGATGTTSGCAYPQRHPCHPHDTAPYRRFQFYLPLPVAVVRQRHAPVYAILDKAEALDKQPTNDAVSQWILPSCDTTRSWCVQRRRRIAPVFLRGVLCGVPLKSANDARLKRLYRRVQ